MFSLFRTITLNDYTGVCSKWLLLFSMRRVAIACLALHSQIKPSLQHTICFGMYGTAHSVTFVFFIHNENLSFLASCVLDECIFVLPSHILIIFCEGSGLRNQCRCCYYLRLQSINIFSIWDLPLQMLLAKGTALKTQLTIVIPCTCSARVSSRWQMRDWRYFSPTFVLMTLKQEILQVSTKQIIQGSLTPSTGKWRLYTSMLLCNTWSWKGVLWWR